MDTYISLLKRFNEEKIENAQGELLEIISCVCGQSFDEIVKLRLDCKAGGKDLLSLFPEFADRIIRLAQLRLSGKPVQYLTHRSPFYGLELYVDERVLIPRFDTECVVDTTISLLPKNADVLDLCCGSGCIGVSIGVSRKDARITFADKSGDALAVARRNAEKYGIAGSYICCDIFMPPQFGMFDIIVSNPPYISAEEMEVLDREVKQEPVLSLFGGEDGLDFYRRIPTACKAHIRNGGYLILECGAGQARDAANLCMQAGYSDICFQKDLNGIQRCVIARNFI